MATTEEEQVQITIPSALPMLAVRDVVVFPNMVLPLFVGRETSVLAIEAALAQDRLIFLATQKDQAVENPEPEDIYPVGTASLILRMLKLPDGRLKILVQGKAKAMVQEYIQVGHNEVSGRMREFFQIVTLCNFDLAYQRLVLKDLL